jgi:hypothetical protein
MHPRPLRAWFSTEHGGRNVMSLVPQRWSKRRDNGALPDPSRAYRNETIQSAIAGVYRGCHLQSPSVFAAQDAVHFARLTHTLARGSVFLAGTRIVGLFLVTIVLLAAHHEETALAVYFAFNLPLFDLSGIFFGWPGSGSSPTFSFVALRTFGPQLFGTGSALLLIALRLKWQAALDSPT